MPVGTQSPDFIAGDAETDQGGRGELERLVDTLRRPRDETTSDLDGWSDPHENVDEHPEEEVEQHRTADNDDEGESQTRPHDEEQSQNPRLSSADVWHLYQESQRHDSGKDCTENGDPEDGAKSRCRPRHPDGCAGSRFRHESAVFTRTAIAA